jgi:hypothetical protein
MVKIFLLRSLSMEEAVVLMQEVVEKAVDSKDVSSGLVPIMAPDQGLDESFAAGESHGVTDFGQPFHVASVGKLFTVALVGMLVDDV